MDYSSIAFNGTGKSIIEKQIKYEQIRSEFKVDQNIMNCQGREKARNTSI